MKTSNDMSKHVAELETRCGRVHVDGSRCGRRLGPWMLDSEGRARPAVKLVIAPTSAKHLPRGQLWRDGGDDPDRLESRFWEEGYRPVRYWAPCPGCGARPVVRASKMARSIQDAVGRGETVLYLT
jgi:hypothetical protein